jgi:hypothetical protein
LPGAADGADPGIDERISHDGRRLVQAPLLAGLVGVVEVEGIDELVDRVAGRFGAGDRRQIPHTFDDAGGVRPCRQTSSCEGGLT